jgi:hypothetical protein
MDLETIIAIFEAGGNDAVDAYLSNLEQESIESLEAASNMSISVIASTLAIESAAVIKSSAVMVSPPLIAEATGKSLNSPKLAKFPSSGNLVCRILRY